MGILKLIYRKIILPLIIVTGVFALTLFFFFRANINFFFQIHPETFRFLLSALIQVFGALIAVDAFFLILRHESLQKKLNFLKEKLSLKIAMKKNINEVFDSIFSVETEEDKNSCIRDSGTFAHFDFKEFGELITREEKNLFKDFKRSKKAFEKAKKGKSRIDQRLTERNYNKAENSLKFFPSDKKAYIKALDVYNKFPTNVLEIMGLPAFLTIIFCIGLWFSDNCNIDNLSFICFGFIIIAILGFSLLISWARKVFID